MSFIQVRRHGGGYARIRADVISALIEGSAKKGEGRVRIVQIQLGNSNFVTVEGQTIGSLFAMIQQATGGKRMNVIRKAPKPPEFWDPEDLIAPVEEIQAA